MRLKSLRVDGVRGLPDREFDFVDPKRGAAAGIVAVTGPRASGKTSLLEAIIAAKEDVGPYGIKPAPGDTVRPDVDSAKLRAEWELHTIERERVGVTESGFVSESIYGDVVLQVSHEPALMALLESYDLDPAFGKVEYFHATRTLPLGLPIDVSQAAGGVVDKLDRLGRKDTKYGGLVRFVVETGLGLDLGPDGKQRESGRVAKAFEALCSTKRLAGLYRAGKSILPGFFDAGGTAYGLSQLSDSEQDAMLFAATFVRSGLVQNQPGSIVLIDRPELHIGERDAGPFVRALHDLGPENQLIVATRSPAVIEAAHVTISLG